MANTVQMKAALVSVLVATAILGPAPRDWLTAAALLFGVANIIVATRGTGWIRAVAVAASFSALVWPVVFFPLAFLLWLAWLPAYAAAWASARHGAPAAGNQHSGATRARVVTAVIIGAVAIAAVAYRAVNDRDLEQTAALFIGIPAILAIVVVFAATPRSAAAAACKAVTIALLVSLLFMWEGILCVVMSAPLFYAVALFIAYFWEGARARPQRIASYAGLLALVPMSLEGVTPLTSLDRNEEVVETRTVAVLPDDVERAIFMAPRFERKLPLYLRLGFPRPIATTIERGATGTRWIVRLRGGEMKVNGMEPRAGDLVLDLVESRPGYARWRAVSDNSHLTHYLQWHEAVVQWEATGADATRVSWTLRYRRGLDPAWYFGPWERYAARLAAGYLIETVATP